MKTAYYLALACATACASAPAEPASSCAVQPHLKSLESTYFADSCAFSGCHTTADADSAGHLDLSAGKARAQLLGIAAVQKTAAKSGKIRVVAGHPEQSYLIDKVTTAPNTALDRLMPYGATKPYDADCSIAALKTWIANGALDD